MEPYRIKAVEPIPFRTAAQRHEILEQAGHNLFRVRASDITIDLLTDSGTTAMSAAQWAAVMTGDESYAASESYSRFETAVRDLTGFPEVIPVHQGRAAERIVFANLLTGGDLTAANTHFDSTRANIEALGCRALDLPCPEAAELDSDAQFKGNIDVRKLQSLFDGPDSAKLAAVIMTVTNNGGGGQPVSLDNLRSVRELCDEHGVPMLLDASRFAENAWLITRREPGHEGRSPSDVAREMFDLADGCWASLKKDGMSNTGGLIATRDYQLAERCRQTLVMFEGFPTYGGLTGRDLEALGQGLTEVTDPRYLAHREDTAAWFADELAKAGVAVARPAGCHAVYVDAGSTLPHIPAEQFPGHAWACALYREGGIRSVEFGTLVFGQSGGTAQHELVRLALPRRVYTRSHLEYVVSAAATVSHRADDLSGYRIVGEQPPLRHFTATLAPIE